MALQVQHSIAGGFMDLFVSGSSTFLHVATSVDIDLSSVTHFLKPSYLQNQTMQQAEVALNESTYRELALQQLDERLDAWAMQLTAAPPLDCTHLTYAPFLEMNATDMLRLAVISTFDTATVTIQNTTKLLLPDVYCGIVHDEARRLLLWRCRLYGPKSETWLVAWGAEASNDASFAPRAMGHFNGSIDHASTMELWFKNGTDYVRVALCNADRVVQILVLEIPNSGRNDTMPIVGQLLIGNNMEASPLDDIQSILFDGDYAHVVTYRNGSSIFYTIDMTDPRNLYASKGLAIPGYPDYLYAIEPNLILGVGGFDPGTLQQHFDLVLVHVSDWAEPKLTRHWAGTPSNNTSSEVVTVAVYPDRRSFNFVNDGSIAIVPIHQSRAKELCEIVDDDYTSDISVALSGNQSIPGMPIAGQEYCYTSEETEFDGFQLFTINATSGTIAELLKIDHSFPVELYQKSCYAKAGLGLYFPRSMVWNGDITTIKGLSVQCHDLLTQSEVVLDLNDEC